MTDQGHLFGPPPNPVQPAEADDEWVGLATKLPPSIHMGTSSWSFPGWHGLVYRRPYTGPQLAQYGLKAYASHPLFRTVGVDRSYYAPVPRQTWRDWHEATPASFRFLIKAGSDLVRVPERLEGSTFLDPGHAETTLLGPMAEGLDGKAGPVLFQFSRESLRTIGGPHAFADALGEMLHALPKGHLYAVEVREPSWVTPRYLDVLRTTGAVHCVNVYPGMPTVRQQAQWLRETDPCALVIRWMLHPSWTYRAAKTTFAPFRDLQAALPEARQDIVAMLLGALRRHIPAWVILNNKAEGSAPLSVVELARAFAHRSGSSDGADPS